MIDSKKISKLLRGLRLGKPGVADHNLMHPEREWFIGTFLALILLGLSIYWCFDQYRFYSLAETISPLSENSPVIYRERAVAEALEMLENRKMNYEEISLNLRNASTMPIRVPTPFEEATTIEAIIVTSTNPTIIPRQEEVVSEPEVIPDEEAAEPVEEETAMPSPALSI